MLFRSDLDEEEIRRTIREAVDAGRLDAAVTGPDEALRRLHLIDENHVTQAGIVAFAKDVLPDYPQCSLRLARFRGTTKDEFRIRTNCRDMRLLCCRKQTPFFGEIYPFADGLPPIFWPGRMNRSTRRWPCGRLWSTPCATVTTR